MARNPLAEVFGQPVDNMSDIAERYRNLRLCPFHNSSGPQCTKNSASDPLGVCSVFDGNEIAIVCPIRFRQNYLIVEDAAKFFFPNPLGAPVVLTEVRMLDRDGKSAGNIDIVLAQLDQNGTVVDFGAIEIQAVYISGNVSLPFKQYMANPQQNSVMEWPSKNYPTPDYLSSSRKRLAPQLIYKGGILHAWKKKMAVVVHSGFFRTLPKLTQVPPDQADIAWLVYDLVKDPITMTYNLVLISTHYTSFKEALETITTSNPGRIEDFMVGLQKRIDKGKQLGDVPLPQIPPTVQPSVNPFNPIDGNQDPYTETE